MTSSVDGILTDRKLSRHSLRDQAIEILREAIIRGEIRPGSRINEAELAERLGISRGPLREAIQRVGAEGLIEFQRNRGAFVRELGLDDVRLIYEVRQALEGAAARRVARQASTGDIASLRRHLTEAGQVIRSHTTSSGDTETPSMLRSAQSFHVMLLHMCGNPYLQRSGIDIHVQLRVARLRSDHSPEEALQVVREHRAIVTAIGKRDEAAAAEAMSEHLRKSLVRFETADADHHRRSS
jgi:DNA-binding GntR family transcriptional regulator